MYGFNGGYPQFQLLDEHMDAIKVIYPQEYEKLVERIRKLSQD